MLEEGKAPFDAEDAELAEGYCMESRFERRWKEQWEVANEQLEAASAAGGEEVCSDDGRPRKRRRGSLSTRAEVIEVGDSEEEGWELREEEESGQCSVEEGGDGGVYRKEVEDSEEESEESPDVLRMADVVVWDEWEEDWGEESGSLPNQGGCETCSAAVGAGRTIGKGRRSKEGLRVGEGKCPEQTCP